VGNSGKEGMSATAGTPATAGTTVIARRPATAGTLTTPASNSRKASINTGTEGMPTKVATRRKDKRRNASNGINASKSIGKPATVGMTNNGWFTSSMYKDVTEK
jgi:hypothetical protein